MSRELESVKMIESAWSDDRGDIFNMFEGPIHHIAHITCTPGAVRANHYHKTLHQYMYCISGEFESWSCDVDNPEEKVMHIVKPGMIVDTPAMVAHAQRFTKDSVVIALSTIPRSEGSYEDDTYSFEVIEGAYINPELRKG
jgi:quercetin dioxygenase-like cupin family protein